MYRLIKVFFAILLSVGAFSPAVAQEHASKEEAKALVEAALLHVKKVGPEKAFEDFTTDKMTWSKKDLYVFADDMEGVALANGGNPKLVGKSLLTLKDQNGKEFIKDMISVVSSKSEGWVDYDWFNPASKKVDAKSSFVKRIPGYNGFVGAGIYR